MHAPASLLDRYQASDHVGFIGNTSTFELNLRSPPPERARIPIEELDLEGYQSAWLAIGFLNLYEPLDFGAQFDWEDFGDHDFPVTWGGNEEYLVIYWSSRVALQEGEIHTTQPELSPGLHLISINDEGVMRRMNPQTAQISMELEAWWAPSFEICRWNGDGERVDIWSDAENFPSSFPKSDEVVCGQCGWIYDYEMCTVGVSSLCSDCSLQRVWMPEPDPPETDHVLWMDNLA